MVGGSYNTMLHWLAASLARNGPRFKLCRGGSNTFALLIHKSFIICYDDIVRAKNIAFIGKP